MECLHGGSQLIFRQNYPDGLIDLKEFTKFLKEKVLADKQIGTCAIRV